MKKKDLAEHEVVIGRTKDGMKVIVNPKSNNVIYYSFGLSILLYCVAWIFVDVNNLAGSLLNKFIAPLLGFGSMAMPHDPIQYLAIFFAWVVFFNFFIAHALEFGMKLWGKSSPKVMRH